MPLPYASRLSTWLWLMGAALAVILLGQRGACGQPKVRLDVIPAGATTYLPGRWGTIDLTFTNLDEHPDEVMAATGFDSDRSLQFCRRAWVPARARLTLSHPIHLPLLEERVRPFEYQTLLLDPNQEKEDLLRPQLDLKISNRLRLGEEPSTALMSMRDESNPDEVVRELPYELVVAAKSSQLLGRNMAQLNDVIFPATPEAYGCIDEIIVGDNRLTHDGPAITAIRRWMYGGGHLWVMLDRSSPELLERLLGDEMHLQVVDKVELTNVKIVPTARMQGTETSQRDYDRSVQMLRVVASDVEVACTVDGWPAAFWKQCGRGKLLVTTLSPDGWMRQGITAEEAGPITRAVPGRRRPLDGPLAQTFPSPPPRDEQEAALLDRSRSRTYFVVAPMKQIASEFFLPREPLPIDARVFDQHVTEYVGSSVPSRWLITSMLGGFGALLAGVGLVLWRASRLEWLGAAGPVLAVGVSAVLVVMGLSQRRSVPSTVASVQFVQAISGTNDVVVSGQTDIFAPEAATTPIASHTGGWIMPDRKGQEAQTARMVWNDMESWEWQHLPPNYSHRLGEFSTSTSTAIRIQARATFDKNGLVGRLDTAALTNPEDLIVATPTGRIGVDLKPDGSFEALSTRVFSNDQYIGAGLLSDEQNRRSRTMAAIFTGENAADFPSEPNLLVWSDPVDVRFEFDKGHRQLGSALVAVPLVLERPQPGTEISIPAPFLTYRQVNGPDGLVAAGLYDHRHHEWQQRFRPSSAWLRFDVPQVLQPLQPLRAKVAVQVFGPIGKLELAVRRGNETVPLKTWTDPVGSLSAEIDDPAGLQTTDGSLLLKVSGGDASRPGLTETGGKANYWQIESLQLTLQAKTALAQPADQNAAPQP
jgi:hypothetical protein